MLKRSVTDGFHAKYSNNRANANFCPTIAPASRKLMALLQQTQAPDNL